MPHAVGIDPWPADGLQAHAVMRANPDNRQHTPTRCCKHAASTPVSRHPLCIATVMCASGCGAAGCLYKVAACAEANAHKRACAASTMFTVAC